MAYARYNLVFLRKGIFVVILRLTRLMFCRTRMSSDVEVEEEAADLAAAQACRGCPTLIVSESQMQGAVSRRAAQK